LAKHCLFTHAFVVAGFPPPTIVGGSGPKCRPYGSVYVLHAFGRKAESEQRTVTVRAVLRNVRLRPGRNRVAVINALRTVLTHELAIAQVHALRHCPTPPSRGARRATRSRARQRTAAPRGGF